MTSEKHTGQTRGGERSPSFKATVRYFGRLIALSRAHWNAVALGFGLSVIGTLGTMATPLLSRLFFDEVYPRHDVSLLALLVVGVATVSVVTAAQSALRAYYTQAVTARLTSAATLMFFAHLLRLPLRFFEQRRLGEIMSRSNDVRASITTVARLMQGVLVNSLYLLFVPPILIAMNWRLAVLALLAAPFIAALAAATNGVVRRTQQQAVEAAADLNATQLESLAQIRTVKGLSLESRMFQRLSAETAKAMRLQLTGTGFGGVVGIANAVFSALATAGYTYYAWKLVLSGAITLGDFIAFSAYASLIIGPVGQMTSLPVELQQAAVTLGRAFEYLDAPSDFGAREANTNATQALPEVGEVALEDVSFAFDPGRDVVHGLTLKFLRGTVTAIVGASGSGKSTVLRLMAGLERPRSGRLLIDGVPVANDGIVRLRKSVSLVWQDPSLLRGSIWENLTIAADNPERLKVDTIAEACQLRELILELPSGYNTMIAEAGATLSGGQRQRLALARAMIRDSPILLLDEVSSQLDSETERRLLTALMPFLRSKIVVIVTHRQSVAMLCDRICLISNHKLGAMGTHSQLFADCVEYREYLGLAETPQLAGRSS